MPTVRSKSPQTKAEALNAIVGPTMRPSALEAATTQTPGGGTGATNGTPHDQEHVRDAEKSSTTLQQPHTPFGQRTDGTQSATKAAEEVAHSVKAAVDGAFAWAEKKARELSSASDSTGPYTSQATCAPSDLDPIASGVLATMGTQGMGDTNRSMEEQGAQGEKAESEARNNKRKD